jgi:hypothetical protein
VKVYASGDRKSAGRHALAARMGCRWTRVLMRWILVDIAGAGIRHRVSYG